MLEKAVQIAVSAHKEQVDKSEQPYILHLIRVMDAGETEQEKICGILHDLVEDTDWTFEKLENEGFSEEIISALKCVTKQENEDYDAFIGRVKTNPLAINLMI